MRPDSAWCTSHDSPRDSAARSLATAAMAGVAANRLAGTVLFPSGDEPHYLVMAQSLWRDGDLQIENNHTRGDYHEYYAPDLDPHYLTRGRNGQIYSIHPIGIAVLLSPIYALGGYTASVWALILMGALASALAWRWTVATINALNREVAQLLTDPEVRRKFLNDNSTPASPRSPDELRKIFLGEMEKWDSVVKRANIKLEE